MIFYEYMRKTPPEPETFFESWTWGCFCFCVERAGFHALEENVPKCILGLQIDIDTMSCMMLVEFIPCLLPNKILNMEKKKKIDMIPSNCHLR